MQNDSINTFCEIRSPVKARTHRRYPHAGLRIFHRKSSYPNEIDFKAICGASLVTQHPRIWGQRNFCSPPYGSAPGLKARVPTGAWLNSQALSTEADSDCVSFRVACYDPTDISTRTGMFQPTIQQGRDFNQTSGRKVG